jgi:hypothetical protein
MIKAGNGASHFRDILYRGEGPDSLKTALETKEKTA